MFRVRNEIKENKKEKKKGKGATNEADKNHFKLLNNAVYGKTMENMRKRIKIRVVKNAKDFIKYTSRPTCINWKVFENNLVAIHEKKISLALNKPIYVGFTVLEISKCEMFNFHDNFMIRKFNSRLLFTDTDSLCYKHCASTKNCKNVQVQRTL